MFGKLFGILGTSTGFRVGNETWNNFKDLAHTCNFDPIFMAFLVIIIS